MNPEPKDPFIDIDLESSRVAQPKTTGQAVAHMIQNVMVTAILCATIVAIVWLSVR